MHTLAFVKQMIKSRRKIIYKIFPYSFRIKMFVKNL